MTAYEWKFKKPAERFHKSIDQILEMGYSNKDLIHLNTAFTGMITISRQLVLYELYKRTLDVNGHIAEVGTWKGASLLYFAKLVQLFEPYSHTLVIGFDWFKGMQPSEKDSEDIKPDSYLSEYEQLLKLIKVQELDNIVHVHNMDVTKELEPFLNENPGLEFKIVFLDAGVYEVVRTCAPLFWERLNRGGGLILDHFGDLRVSGEMLAIREVLPEVKVQTFPWCRHPSGYVIKP